MRALLLLIFSLAVSKQTLADVPQSSRSKSAIERVEAQLRRDIEAKGFNYSAPIFIQITKIPAELNIFIQTETSDYEHFRTYPVCRFSGGLGPKKRRGDRKSPEGFYSIRASQMNPASSYHLSFNLGYPNAYDRVQGYTGDYLMVHGSCVSIGCYAMTDAAIEEIWALMTASFEAGQKEIPVHIFPYRMNWLMRISPIPHPDHKFWRQLEPAWRLFSTTKRPPKITLVDGQYVISAQND